MERRLLMTSLLAVALIAGCGGNSDVDVPGDRDTVGQDGVDPVDAVGSDAGDTGSTGRDLNGVDELSGDVFVGTDTASDTIGDDSGTADAADAGREFGIDVINIGFDPEFSQCGGFRDVEDPFQQSRNPFCGQPSMKWEVDPVTGIIKLTFLNIAFNCCGEHEIAVENDDGVIIVRLIDRPTDDGDRCSCTCGYDYVVYMPPLIDAVQATFQLYYIIDGEYYPPEAEGHGGHFWIDLRDGAGEFPVDGIGGMCNTEIWLGRNIRVSDCGGFSGTTAAGDACRPETLDWFYNSVDHTVSVINSNVVLNCCGERFAYAVQGWRLGDQIIELDVPPEDGGRCDCRCMVDFAMELVDQGWGGGTGGEFSITRTIPDADVPETLVWNDNLDFTVGFGTIVIKEAADNCI